MPDTITAGDTPNSGANKVNDKFDDHDARLATLEGTGHSHLLALNDLTDVDTTGSDNGEVLKFNGSTWVPGTDVGSGGTGAVVVERNDVQVSASANTLDFSTAFNVTESPAGEANVSPNFGAAVNTIVQGNDSRLSEGAAGTATVRTLGTTSTSACAGNDARLTRIKDLVLYNGKDPVVLNDETGEYPITDAGTITRIVARTAVAPTGSPLSISVRKNGGEVLSFSIAAGSKTSNQTPLSIALSDGDYLTAKVVSPGSSTPGSKLTVLCREVLA